MRVCFVPSPHFSEPGILNHVWNLKKYFREVDLSHANIVHVHGAEASPIIDVATCHGWYWKEDWGETRYGENNNIFGNIHRAKEVIAVSRWYQERLKEMGVDSIYIPNGVDHKLFSPQKEGSYILYAGISNEARDPLGVIELAKEFPDLKFKMTIDAIEDAPPNIEFLGEEIFRDFRGQFPKLLSDSLFTITTCPREPFGLATLQSWACGKPVLGMTGGGNSEFIDHKKTGYIYEDYDDMKAGLEFLLGSDLYDNCVKESQKYDWKEMAKETQKVYDKVWKIPVSVTVLAYNNHHDIDRALRSCGNGPEIVMCDASVNHQAYKLNRNRFIYIQTKNKSIGNNRNLACKAATQPYITQCDADDYLLDGKISQLYHWFSELPEDVGMVWGNGFWGDVTFKDAIKQFHNLDLEHYSNITAEQLLKGNFIPSGSVMFRRSVWEKIKFDDELNFGEDFDLYLRILDEGFKIIYIDVLCYVYASLKNESTISKTYKKKHEDLRRTLNKAVERFPARQFVHGEMGVFGGK